MDQSVLTQYLADQAFLHRLSASSRDIAEPPNEKKKKCEGKRISELENKSLEKWKTEEEPYLRDPPQVAQQSDLVAGLPPALLRFGWCGPLKPQAVSRAGKFAQMNGGDQAQFQLNPYNNEVFQGVMPDTGAAKKSSVGKGQAEAAVKENPALFIDTSRAGEASLKFGDGKVSQSLGVITMTTPFGKVDFYVLPNETPFLLSLDDMDRLQVEFRNLENKLVHKDGRWIPVMRKFSHPWFMMTTAGDVNMTETELRRIHARFGHPSIYKFHKILKRAGEEVELDTLEMIEKFCHFCQMKGTAPMRFKFTLKDDVDFNHSVYVDVMHLPGEKNPVLHVVDSSTAFQAGRFLTGETAGHIWRALQHCWLDTYNGPPDVIIHDSGTNLSSKEFRVEAKLRGIVCQQVPIEAHHSVGKVERYHVPLRRAFEIITREAGDKMSREERLQAAFSAVNNTAGPEGLVPSLLVFGAIPKMKMDSPPQPSQVQRAKAIEEAMRELRRLRAKQQVKSAANTRNGPDTSSVLPSVLPLGSEVAVFRENGKWEGPIKVLAVSATEVTVDGVNGPQVFRNSFVKPYYRHPDGIDIPATPGEVQPSEKAPEKPPEKNPDPEIDGAMPWIYPEPPPKRKRGRPPGSKNKAKKKKPGRPRKKAPVDDDDSDDSDGEYHNLVEGYYTWENDSTTCIAYLSVGRPDNIFMSPRERSDYELALKLRQEGKILTAGAPFQLSDESELNSLLANRILVPVKFDKEKHGKMRIFKARMVREVKSKTTSPYEKSRLVIQGHSDKEKVAMMTQAPTIQRSTQRLIFALIPTFRKVRKDKVCLRDITQAYTQSDNPLNREVFAQLPKELKEKYPEGIIMQVLLPLYGLAEAGAHWWATYFRHHRIRLKMEPSPYDPCLFISVKGEDFGIAGLQTDDTINVGSEGFMDKEQREIVKAAFRCKPRTMVETGSSEDFNGCKMIMYEDHMIMRQKGQAEKLALIDLRASERKQQYIEQRARGAYLASICQPEAAFDLSAAAQVREPSDEDIRRLNKRIEWQIKNKERGLRFDEMDLKTAKLFVFVDGSFANNEDLASQIGFVIAIGNESSNDGTFTLHGNIIHWSSTKCKRVTRSVLASEIYGMVSGFDTGYVINRTLDTILDRVDKKGIPLVICTDSRSLYQCLVQLGTTAEKRLMIDVMALRQSYEAREIAEIRWIHGNDNPSDAMTKSKCNQALENLVSDNRIEVRVEGWVDRKALAAAAAAAEKD